MSKQASRKHQAEVEEVPDCHCVPACVPAYLPACLPAGLPTCRPAYLPTCRPAYLPACLRVWACRGGVEAAPSTPPALPPPATYLPTYLHAYMQVSTAARRRHVRAARLVQMQSRELGHMRLSWATCAVYAHLAASARLSEASALRRWQRVCTMLSQPTAAPAPTPTPTSIRADGRAGGRTDGEASSEVRELGGEMSSEMSSEMRELGWEMRRERTALLRGWATAKLRIALSPAPTSADGAAISLAFRGWERTCAAMRGGGL